jgi:hypothetical protein
MLDIDPGLDAKLRAFFEHIEVSAPPAGLTDIGVAAPARGGRTFNLFAGLVAAAVVAASVVVFAVELRSHGNPAPGPAVTSAAPSSSFAPASRLKKMPLLGGGGVPASAHVVIPLTRGQGSMALKTFVPQGTMYIQFVCAGPGPLNILSADRVIGESLSHCPAAPGVTTMTVESPNVYDNKPLTLHVTADPAMTWEVYVAQSRAPLTPFTVLGDQRVLVPVTYGTGSITLPTFSVGPGESLHVRDACNSGSSADTLELTGGAFFGDETQYQCSTPSGVTGGSFMPAGGSGAGPISIHLRADPSISWEILITEGPGPLELQSSSVGVAPAMFGMGSASLPAFTPTKSYSIAVVCSGIGTLRLGSSNFTHTATPTCGGITDSFTPPGQVPGQSVSLSVEAPALMGWEVYIYNVEPSSSPAACPPFRPAGSSPTPCVVKGG